MILCLNRPQSLHDDLSAFHLEVTVELPFKVRFKDILCSVRDIAECILNKMGHTRFVLFIKAYLRTRIRDAAFNLFLDHLGWVKQGDDVVFIGVLD